MRHNLLVIASLRIDNVALIVGVLKSGSRHALIFSGRRDTQRIAVFKHNVIHHSVTFYTNRRKLVHCTVTGVETALFKGRPSEQIGAKALL